VNKQVGYLLGGCALILLGVFLPREWYDALPRSREQLPPPPVKGVTLLQIAFVIEGVALIWFSTKRWRFVRLFAHERLLQTVVSEQDQDIKNSTALWLLAAITVGALILRCVHLGADLWLDEITPIFDYRQMPVLHIVTTYISSNNHLLNTLLMKLVLALFGEQEWALRLPALLFGVATIPAIYWVSRFALSKRASLCVATVVAVSYHHIFFSQNARGYTAYLFFSVLSSGLLVKGLQEDRARDWVLYGLTTFLNFASLLDSIFVFASHVLVGVIALVVVKRNGGSPLPLARRLAAVFTLTGVFVLDLYVTMAPQFYIYSKTVYHDPAAGFSPVSVEFLQELAHGLSGAFGRNLFLGLFPFMIVAATGFFILLRRQWALTVALTLPGVLTAVFLLAQGLDFSPRFFLLWLPLAMLVAVQGIFSLTGLLVRTLGITQIFAPRLATLLVLIGVSISLFSLKHYYLVPKQSYRASLQYVATQRQPGDPIIASYLSEHGYRFYGKRFGLTEGEDWFPVRSVESLDSVLSRKHGHRSIVVTTFMRSLRISRPDLLKRILEGWTLDRTFPATIGDGEISVWKERPGGRELNFNNN
jgi:mannosyltransferase